MTKKENLDVKNNQNSVTTEDKVRLEKVKKMSEDELRRLYQERDIEPAY